MPDTRSKVISMTTGHRTKAEKEFRKEAEKSLYTGVDFKESDQVAADKIAHREFLRLKKMFAKIPFIDGLDEQVINRYCLEVSALSGFQDSVATLDKMFDESETVEQRIEIKNMILKTLSAMMKSKELLLKYEDRLFLNPAGRVKSIPKAPPAKEKPSGMAAYLAKKG